MSCWEEAFDHFVVRGRNDVELSVVGCSLMCMCVGVWAPRDLA